MHHAAQACALAERRLGHDSELVDVEKPESWEGAEHADIHVLHTCFPDEMRARIAKRYRVIFVPHGTPEVLMETAVETFARPGYGPADPWMLLREWLRSADAVVTFWDRHRAFYQSMMPQERTIHCVPMGVDLEFWRGGTKVGKYAGTPSVWTSENQYRIKWALDILMAWPWVLKELRGARLHANYLVYPLHRFFIDLANSNGAAFGSYLSTATYSHESLRDIWTGLDFFLSPVRYGDHNCIFMQAAATGMKTISYRGNEYAHYWITEGDQRVIAQELVAIFKGEVEPRIPTPIPDVIDMGRAMVAIYERALAADSPSDAETTERAQMMAALVSLADGGAPTTKAPTPFDPSTLPPKVRELFKDWTPPTSSGQFHTPELFRADRPGHLKALTRRGRPLTGPPKPVAKKAAKTARKRR